MHADRAQVKQGQDRRENAPKPIWEQFAEAFGGVPDEELDRLPTDLAANVDHYVYGLPKRMPWTPVRRYVLPGGTGISPGLVQPR
jgi:hypothetical protein